MVYEWDERKNRQNLRKHRISFELAQEVFADPFCLTVSDRVVEGDERYWTIGRIENLAILVVVHSINEDQGQEIIRIVSARKATPRERRFYEEVDE